MTVTPMASLWTNPRYLASGEWRLLQSGHVEENALARQLELTSEAFAVNRELPPPAYARAQGRNEGLLGKEDRGGLYLCVTHRLVFSSHPAAICFCLCFSSTSASVRTLKVRA